MIHNTQPDAWHWLRARPGEQSQPPLSLLSAESGIVSCPLSLGWPSWPESPEVLPDPLPDPLREPSFGSEELSPEPLVLVLVAELVLVVEGCVVQCWHPELADSLLSLNWEAWCVAPGTGVDPRAAPSARRGFFDRPSSAMRRVETSDPTRTVADPEVFESLAGIAGARCGVPES